MYVRMVQHVRMADMVVHWTLVNGEMNCIAESDCISLTHSFTHSLTHSYTECLLRRVRESHMRKKCNVKWYRVAISTIQTHTTHTHTHKQNNITLFPFT